MLPRTEIEIDTVFHSSYSGLFVQSRISNMGTEEITDLKVKISVWNGTEMLETDTHYPGILSAKQSVKLGDLHQSLQEVYSILSPFCKIN